MNPHLLGTFWVSLQFSLLAVLGLLCLQQAGQQPPGLASHLLWLASVLLGLWTLRANRPGNFNIRPEPRAQGRLVTTGPYRWVRHPMYTAVLLLAAGASAWLASLAGAVLWLALLGVLVAKARLEEHWLQQRYPDYAAYRKGTWWLLPGMY